MIFYVLIRPILKKSAVQAFSLAERNMYIRRLDVLFMTWTTIM